MNCIMKKQCRWNKKNCSLSCNWPLWMQKKNSLDFGWCALKTLKYHREFYNHFYVHGHLQYNKMCRHVFLYYFFVVDCGPFVHTQSHKMSSFTEDVCCLFGAFCNCISALSSFFYSLSLLNLFLNLYAW